MFWGRNKSKNSESFKTLEAQGRDSCILFFLIYKIIQRCSSSETQGQSVGSGEKVGRKFSSSGERAPGYQLSPNYFQKFKRIPAPDWAQKVLCIIVPNRRTVSPEFFSWVRTRQLLSRHTCPVRSPSLCVQGKLLFSTFPTRNEGTTDESKERLGCYQQEQLNLPRQYSVFDGSQCIVNNRKFKMRQRRETRQNNNFARASRLFVQFRCRQLHDYPWKWLISRFVKDLNKQWQNSFSSWTWIWLIKFSSKRVRLHLWQSKRVGIITI